MEKQLKCVSVLSLKEMTLRKVATLLLNDPDTVASIPPFQFPVHHSPESIRKWLKIIEIKVIDKMGKLELLESLEKEVIDIVKPIGSQIWRWKVSQENYLISQKFMPIGLKKEVWKDFQIRLPDSSKLFWTSSGMVDYRKTAQELVRRDALDVLLRYDLACANCLEDDIPLLWEMLPGEKKRQIYGVLCPINTSPELLVCWPRIITGELSSLDYLWRRPDRRFSSFNQWAFECSSQNGNKAAVEYFFHKLTAEEREASLARTFEALLRSRIRSVHLLPFLDRKLSDVFCYLLASVSPAQQMEVFREHPGEVLLRFLCCPWPDLFSYNLALMWDHLPPSSYGDLLVNMARRFAQSDDYSPQLFREFFVRSPPACKKSFIDRTSASETPAALFLSTFIKYGDSESVKVVFRNMDAADRMRLVLSKDVLRVFRSYLLQGGWNMMEVCVREATQSEVDRKRLKKAFIEYCGGGRARSELIHGQLFDFLDEADASGDQRRKAQKRKMEN